MPDVASYQGKSRPLKKPIAPIYFASNEFFLSLK
jgi:hypothetical protein